MNRNAIDESEHVAAGSSDLRNTNPWLASYGSGTVRSPRSSKPSLLDLRWWVAAGAAVLLALGIGATGYVAAAGTRAEIPVQPAEPAQSSGPRGP
jgi:hypothetical protein